MACSDCASVLAVQIDEGMNLRPHHHVFNNADEDAVRSKLVVIDPSATD
jgi:hypothetical protein